MSRGKYFAICEGDDYWSDSYKLSFQVNVLESKPEVFVSVHNATLVNCITNESEILIKKIMPEIMSVKDVITRAWFAPTSSMVFRSIAISKPNHNINGDIYLLFVLSLSGCIHYCETPYSVYRFLSEGSLSLASRGADKFAMYRKKFLFFNYINLRDNFIKNPL